MRVRAPILVTTDPRDDLGRARAHVRVEPDGALTLLDELDREDLERGLERFGVLVLAHPCTPAAMQAIGRLCAHAREHRLPAILLRRDVRVGEWIDHPASIVADVPAWLWPDMRAAWTSWLEHFAFVAAGVDPWGARASELIYVAGDRRHARFLRAWEQHPLMDEPGVVRTTTGFVVPSLLDSHPETRIAHVPAHRAGGRTYTQGWYARPIDAPQVDPRALHALRTVSLDVAFHDDTALEGWWLDDDVDKRTAQALAVLHSVHDDWTLLESIVDHVMPRPTQDAPPSREQRGARRARSRLLRFTLDALGNPPAWRRAGAQQSWEAELAADDVAPARDTFANRRRHIALEPDDVDGRVVFVACDLEGERMLPAVRWRRPTLAPPHNLRWQELRDNTFGAHTPETHESPVPVNARGTVRAPFAVVRFGDRLPRGEPALVVLLGEWTSTIEAVGRIQRGGKTHVPVIPCAIRGTAGDDGAPDFFHAQGFVEWLVHVLTPREDELFALRAEDVGRWFASRPSRGRGLYWIDVEVPAPELVDTMADLKRWNGGRLEPMLGLTVVSHEGDVSEAELRAAFEAAGVGEGCMRGAGTWNVKGMVKISGWWGKEG